MGRITGTFPEHYILERFTKCEERMNQIEKLIISHREHREKN